MKILSKEQASEKITAILPADIQTLSDAFTKAGFDLFLVGGCIRDAFMDRTPKDFDVCTNAMPETVMEILKANAINFQLQGEAFGVVVARMSEDIEIATFRTDVSANTGRNSDDAVILGVTIEEDVARRDLTINALFMNLQTGEIIDLVGGIEDLNKGFIRTVGNPSERFAEDNLRKLRAIRFASRYDFKIDIRTLEAIQDDPKLNVSGERIVTELQNAFSQADPAYLAHLLYTTGLVHEILGKEKILIPTWHSASKATCFTTFIASFFDSAFDLSDIDTFLADRKFSSQVSAGVKFLFTFDGNCQQPILFKKKLRSTSLTASSLVEFHKDARLELLADLELPAGLAQSLMDQGITGKDLGDAMEKAAFEFFEAQLTK